MDTAERRQSAQDRMAAECARLVEVEERWEKEQSLVDRILELRARLRGRTGEVEGTETRPEQAADGATETLPVDAEPPVIQVPPEPEGDAQTPSPEAPADAAPPPMPAPSDLEDEEQPLSAEQRPGCSRNSNHYRPSSRHSRARPRSSSPA